MTTEFLPFEERFILFADLLGSTETSISDDYKNQRSIVGLLREIQTLTSENSVKSTPSDENSSGHLGTIQISPEFSAFSDHFVASYRLNDDQNGFGKNFWLVLFLQEAQRIIGVVSFQALRLGLLVRGGITIGNLHHESGVVFGKGLIEAYELESKVAIYPRIVVGPKIYQEASSDMQSKLCQDTDGIWHLEYFRELFSYVLSQNQDSKCAHSISWGRSTLDMINKTIDSLEKEGKLKEMGKWVWFRNRFEYEKSRIGKFNPFPEEG